MVDIRDVFPLLSRLLQRQKSVTGSNFLPEVSVLSSGVEMQPQKEQNGGKVLILKAWPAARSIFTTKFNFLALWKLLMNEAALRAEKSLYKIIFFSLVAILKSQHISNNVHFLPHYSSVPLGFFLYHAPFLAPLLSFPLLSLFPFCLSPLLRFLLKC